MKNAAKHLFSLFVIFCFVGCGPQKAEGYQFITEEFAQALSQISAAAFFDPTLPLLPSEDQLIPSRLTRDLVYKRDVGMHYAEIGDRLCGDIEASYKDMVGNGISSHNSFAFDEELIKFFIQNGAYVFPVDIERMDINATFYPKDGDDKSAVKRLMEDYKKLPNYDDLANFPQLTRDGAFKALIRGGERGGITRNFPSF